MKKLLIYLLFLNITIMAQTTRMSSHPKAKEFYYIGDEAKGIIKYDPEENYINNPLCQCEDPALYISDKNFIYFDKNSKWYIWDQEEKKDVRTFDLDGLFEWDDSSKWGNNQRWAYMYSSIDGEFIERRPIRIKDDIILINSAYFNKDYHNFYIELKHKGKFYRTSFNLVKPSSKTRTRNSVSSSRKGEVIYITSRKAEANKIIYVTSRKAEADNIIYKTKYKGELSNNNYWMFTKYKGEATLKVYYTKYKGEADLKVYFTKSKGEVK